MSSYKIYKRRMQIKKLLLQGLTEPEIAKQLNISLAIVKRDLSVIKKWIEAQVQTNEYLMTRQVEAITRHLEHLNLIKKELWQIYEELKTQRAYKRQLDTLLSLLKQQEHEARILKLLGTPVNINIKKYIHIDKLQVLMTHLVKLVKEFVPQDKQKYALERLRTFGNLIYDEKEEAK
ncbi:MAG: ECF-type sigma factor [Candidatus Odinarchaeia archaeon]